MASNNALRSALVASFALSFVGGCAAKPPPPPATIAPAAPPKDDGKAAKGGSGGAEHSAALEQLKTAALMPRVDKQKSLRLRLPDGDRWTRVKFWGVPSLLGFRYGKEQHAIVGGNVLRVDDNGVIGACSRAFDEWAKPQVVAFDIQIEIEKPAAFVWDRKIVEVVRLSAKTATILWNEEYALAYALYPAWQKNACLVVGVAVPLRGDIDRAHAVRDRFVDEVFPELRVIAAEEPKERY